MSVKAEFLEGNGFKDTKLSKLIVHRTGLTLDSVLNHVCWNVSFLESVALHIGYNGLGKIAFIRPIPSEFIRLAEPDDTGIIMNAAVVPYLDDDYNKNKKTKFTTLPLFNPDPAVVLEQIAEAGGIDKYKGQLFYHSFWAPGDGHYHIPSYFKGGVEAIESEGHLAKYDWRTITSGFNISGIFTCLGKSKEGDKGYAYDPMQDPTSIEYQLSEHQGAANAASIMVIRAEDNAELEAMEFHDTTGANLADRYISTANRIENRITRAFRVPNELVNIRREGGIAPTGDEIKVSSQLMQQSVNRLQRKISEIFALILTYWKDPVAMDSAEPCKIENLNYFPDQGTAQSSADTSGEASKEKKKDKKGKKKDLTKPDDDAPVD